MSEIFQDPADLLFDPASLDQPLQFRLELGDPRVQHGLAERFGLERLVSMEAQGQLSHRHGLLHLECELTCALVQVCAVSLEPFDDRIELALETYFVPEADLPQLQDDESMNEALTADGLADVGEFLLQSFSLALPDIPRKPGLEPLERSFGPKWQPEEKPNPFAALAGLKVTNKAPDD